MEKFPNQVTESPLRPDSDSSAELEKKRNRQSHNLHKIYTAAMNTQDLGTYASFGEPGFSGDGATLYILAELEGKPQVLWVGGGEFSVNTFTKNPSQNEPFSPLKYADRFAAIKTPLFVVRQGDSYFIQKGDREFELRQNDPAGYLAEFAIMVADDKKVTVNDRRFNAFREEDREASRRKYRAIEGCDVTSFDPENTIPEPYEVLLARGRNALIENRGVQPEVFANFLARLPDGPEILADYLYEINRERNRHRGQAASPDSYSDKEKCSDLVKSMATEDSGIAIGHIDAMNSILSLKQEFDFEQRCFVPDKILK